jgi:hypothetical protein
MSSKISTGGAIAIRRGLEARAPSARQQIVNGRRHCEAGESDKDDSDRCLPDVASVAPQSRNYVPAVHLVGSPKLARVGIDNLRPDDSLGA